MTVTTCCTIETCRSAEYFDLTGLQFAVYANHGHINLFVFVNRFSVNNTFNTLEYLLMINLHVTNDMATCQNVLRMEDDSSACHFIAVFVLPRRWCMNRNWPATNPTHRTITYQERTTMAYRTRAIRLRM